MSFEADESDTTRTKFLKFWLARYSMEGEFEGMQELRGELSSCFMDMEEVQAMKTFGIITENSC